MLLFFLAAGTCGRHRGRMTQFTTPDPAAQDVLDMGMSMTPALSINTIHAFVLFHCISRASIGHPEATGK